VSRTALLLNNFLPSYSLLCMVESHLMRFKIIQQSRGAEFDLIFALL